MAPALQGLAEAAGGGLGLRGTLASWTLLSPEEGSGQQENLTFHSVLCSSKELAILLSFDLQNRLKDCFPSYGLES